MSYSYSSLEYYKFLYLVIYYKKPFHVFVRLGESIGYLQLWKKYLEQVKEIN